MLVIRNGRLRCTGANPAGKIGSVDPMAANGKPSKKIIFSGGEAARSAFGRQETSGFAANRAPTATVGAGTTAPRDTR